MTLNRCLRWAAAAALGLLIYCGSEVVASAQSPQPTLGSDSKAQVQVRPRARVRVYPRRSRYLPPNATRQCRAWLEREYRVSGPVVVPRMHCWWQ